MATRYARCRIDGPGLAACLALLLRRERLPVGGLRDAHGVKPGFERLALADGGWPGDVALGFDDLPQ
jgi:hypothetical protein